MKYKRLALLVFAVLMVTVVGRISAQDSLETTARDFVADTYGVSADGLIKDYELALDVPGIGVVTHYKLRNPVGDAIYGSVVDSLGQAWTPEDFRVAADAAYSAQYGKLDVQLYQLYENDPGIAIPVEIWLVLEDSLLAGLRGPDHVGPGLGLNAEPAIQGERTDNDGGAGLSMERIPNPSVQAAQVALDGHVADLQAGIASRLANKGVMVRAVQGAPVLQATLNREQAQVVSEDPDVGRIFADDIQNQDMNSSATVTQRGPVVWGRGYTGTGAKVAILEDSRAYQNYWLYNYAAARDWNDPNEDNHATQTMGNIGSSHPLHHGMARGASLYSANATSYATANLQAAANWAVAQNVDIINNSWGPGSPSGCLSSMGMFFDYRVVADRVLVTFAAGNSGDLLSDHAMAYNILAVGSFDDRNNGEWGDDRMSSFSAWREGTVCSNSDRQEPDLVAVGSSIRSTTVHPPSIDNQDVQSTSYATAMVSGEAALLLEIDPELVGKPEALRALLMASALHNIEGSPVISEYDGAGGIDAYSAYLDVLNGRWAQMTINPTTWTSYDFTFYAAADRPVSCVAVWTSHPNASYTSDLLLTDLDLRLYSPSMGLKASSTSVSNNYEIVRAIADESGIWTCRVSKYSSSGSTWEYLGIAADYAFQYPYDYPYTEDVLLFLPYIVKNK